jgi:uncharacterized integral membrane protein
VFNATFSNISVISWPPVLVVEEAGVPGENHRPWASNRNGGWWRRIIGRFFLLVDVIILIFSARNLLSGNLYRT